jgi:hypothetical protein
VTQNWYGNNLSQEGLKIFLEKEQNQAIVWNKEKKKEQKVKSDWQRLSASLGKGFKHAK